MWKWLRRHLLPYWVVWALAMLGVVFVVAYPFGRNWWVYGIALLVAAMFALEARGRVRSTVVEFSETETERVYVIRQVMRKRRGGRGYSPLSRRTVILLVIGWLAVFAALAFLPDDRAVGADFLLIIVTVVWLAYRLGRRRGTASAPSADSERSAR